MMRDIWIPAVVAVIVWGLVFAAASEYGQHATFLKDLILANSAAIVVFVLAALRVLRRWQR